MRTEATSPPSEDPDARCIAIREARGLAGAERSR
jgi:hypothetical protein